MRGLRGRRESRAFAVTALAAGAMTVAAVLAALGWLLASVLGDRGSASGFIALACFGGLLLAVVGGSAWQHRARLRDAADAREPQEPRPRRP